MEKSVTHFLLFSLVLQSTNNKIELIIENKLIISTGVLPSTGSKGGTHTKAVFVFIGIGILLSFGSLYFN